MPDQFARISAVDAVYGRVNLRRVFPVGQPAPERVAADLIAGLTTAAKHPAVACLAAALRQAVAAQRRIPPQSQAGPADPLDPVAPPASPRWPAGGSGAAAAVAAAGGV